MNRWMSGYRHVCVRSHRAPILACPPRSELLMRLMTPVSTCSLVTRSSLLEAPKALRRSRSQCMQMLMGYCAWIDEYRFWTTQTMSNRSKRQWHALASFSIKKETEQRHPFERNTFRMGLSWTAGTLGQMFYSATFHKAVHMFLDCLLQYSMPHGEDKSFLLKTLSWIVARINSCMLRFWIMISAGTAKFQRTSLSLLFIQKCGLHDEMSQLSYLSIVFPIKA